MTDTQGSRIASLSIGEQYHATRPNVPPFVPGEVAIGPEEKGSLRHAVRRLKGPRIKCGDRTGHLIRDSAKAEDWDEAQKRLRQRLQARDERVP